MVLAVAFIGAGSGAASAQLSSVSGGLFYFHLNSVAYRNENASVLLLDEANLLPPMGSTSQISTVSAAIRNATTIFGTIWVGSVAWVTEPLTEPATIRGTATFTVWLYSDDPATPSFSGVGAGVAVLDQQNQTVGNYVYSFTYANGKALDSTPTELSFSVDLDYNISPGQRLVFAVGVGSTTEGWSMKVLYDNSQYPSRVQLPSTVTVVPEFQKVTPVMIALTLTATILSLSVARRRVCHKRSVT